MISSTDGYLYKEEDSTGTPNYQNVPRNKGFNRAYRRKQDRLMKRRYNKYLKKALNNKRTTTP